MPVGLFGKYPGKRDFLSLNLPTGVVRLLEDWLQSAMAASRHELGYAWGDYYLIHPIWNFRIGSAIAGTDCIGAIMPSIDGVGRYFPLCILAHADPGKRLPNLGCIEAEWLEAVQQRLLSALDEVDVPEPPMLIEGLVDPAGAGPDVDGVEAITGGYRFPVKDPADRDILKRLQELDFAMLEISRSVWWTKGSSLVEAQVISVTGMPDPYMYLVMMGSPARAGGRQA